MPTYEYTCRDCGEHLEAVQRFSDDALTVCPKCGGSLRKVFGAVGIVFKGSGFYKTDNRSKNGRATIPPGEHSATSSEGASKESAAASSAPSSSTETKKEPKKESTSPAATAPASSSGASGGSGSSAP